MSFWGEDLNDSLEDEDPYSPVEDPTSPFEDEDAESPGLQINQEFQAGTGGSSKAAEATPQVETPTKRFEVVAEKEGTHSRRSSTAPVEYNVENLASTIIHTRREYNKELRAENQETRDALDASNGHEPPFSSAVSEPDFPVVAALGRTYVAHTGGAQNGDIDTSARLRRVPEEAGDTLHHEAANIGVMVGGRGLEESISAEARTARLMGTQQRHGYTVSQDDNLAVAGPGDRLANMVSVTRKADGNANAIIHRPGEAQLLHQNGRTADNHGSDQSVSSPEQGNPTRPDALAATSQAYLSPPRHSYPEMNASAFPQTLTPLPNTHSRAARKVSGASSGWINNIQKNIERGAQQGREKLANGGSTKLHGMSFPVSNPEPGTASAPNAPTVSSNTALEAPGADIEMVGSPQVLDFDKMSDISDLAPMVAFIGGPPPKPEYDGSTLDFFLNQQAQNHDRQPTPHEILASQNFGAVDPRTAWPKRISPEEYEEKQLQIKARGTRKQNFGKLLTPQVRKERAEQGWDVHQRGDWRDDEEAREVVMHMEELFGLPKGISDAFVPGVVNGRLVMREREEVLLQTGPGRRKKKVPRRVWPVMGAP